MTRSGSTEVVRLSRQDWLAIIGLLLAMMTTFLVGVGWAYSVLDERVTRVEISDINQNILIQANRKDNEFIADKLAEIKTEIKDAFKEMGEQIGELRKDLNTL